MSTNPLLALGQQIDQEAATRKPQAETPAPQAAAPKGPQADSTVGSFIGGATSSALFGFDDEISGVLATILPGGLDSQQSIWTSGKGFGDTLSANIAAARAQVKADKQAHPWAWAGGEVAGAVVVPIGAGARTASEIARVGVAQGAAYGLGSGETAGERLQGGITGGIAGGVIGGALGKLGEKLAPRIKALFGKAPAEAAVDGATDAVAAEASKLTPEGPIMGVTREGTPILGGTSRNAAGEAEKPLVESLLPARVEGAGAKEVAAGTQVAKAGEAASQGAQGDAQRASLKALQGVVDDLTKAQQTAGDRAVDVTWAASPDVAARTGEWRIGSLEAPEDAQSLLRAIVEGTTEKVSRSDVDLEKAAYDAANRIGEDPEAILAYASQLAGKVGDVDTSMLALRTLWAKTSEDVTDFHLMNVDWDTASDELVQEAAQRIYNLSALSSEVQKVKTGLGRGLRVMQLPTAKAYLEGVKEGVTDGVVSRGQSPLPKTRQEIADWFELWGTTGGDPKRQSAILQGLLTLPTGQKYLRQSMANFFTASILSAPRTVGLNVIGPGFISVIRNVERLAGGAVASINPLLSAEERAGARAVASQSAKAYVQTFSEIGDAFRQALTAAERNHTLVGGGGQSMDAVATYGPLTENLLRAGGAKPGMAYTLGNLINVWPRAFARLNNGLDEFSKRLAYQGEVRVNAMVEASQQGLEGQAFTDFVETAMKGAYDAAGHATDEALLRSAERTTLTSQVGEQGGMVRGFANGMQRLRAAVPEVRYLLPVFNVPANALGETLRRLPIAAIPGVNKVMFERTAKELAGELGPIAQADAHGRALLGGAFLMAGYMMNKAGTLTGAGPQDPTDRKVWLATHQPYSIKVGDTWVRYDKFDILGGLLSIPATIYDASTYHDETRDPQELMFAGVGALAQWFKDRAALKNATGLLALGDDPTKETGTIFTQISGNVASGFYPAALRTVITDGMTNPYLPMKRSWEDYMASVIPGNNVELVRNILGEPTDKPINSVTEAFLPVTLQKTVGYDTDPVLDELDRLYQVTGYSAGADTSAFSYGQFPDKDLKLEDGQSLYTHAMRARQEIEVDGKTLRQTLSELFASSDYNQAVDGRRSGKQTSRGDLNRPYMVGEIFETFNKAIKQRLAAESPKARDYMTAALAKSTDAAYLRDVSVDELVANPDLYRIKGVDKEAFSARLAGGGGSTAALLDAFGGAGQ